MFQNKLPDEVFYISSVTFHELEYIKTSKNKDDNIKYKARKITRLLDENFYQYIPIIYNNVILEYIKSNLGLDISIPDNLIVGTAKYVNDILEEITFITNDICLKNIARSLELEVGSVNDNKDIYKGYQILKGNTEYINNTIQNIDFSNWYKNEYLIIQNIDDNSEKEMRFNGNEFVPLKLPSSKYIKAKNSLQRCALDALINPDINIVAILGTYGSGKSYLCMQMALYHVLEKGNQSNILGVRELRGEGLTPGYLPGDLNDKIGFFFAPLAQQLNGGEFELESLKQRGIIDFQIPYYLKGTTFISTIILADEAEDLQESQIRLIGTRLGENSRIFFSGDYKQSVINSSNNNALIKMCNELKGNENFACVCLDTDVRSNTSKMFAELFKCK